MGKEVSQRELADILGLSTQQVRNLEKQGLPCRGEGRKKHYPIPGAVQWYYRRKQEEAIAAAKPTEFDKARAIGEMARARRAQIELEQLEKRLYTDEVVERVFGDQLLDVVRTRISNVPGRWGAQMGFESPREGEAILRRMVQEVLEELSGPAADELEAGPGLPQGFPGYAALERAGIRTMRELAEVEDLTAIAGIGQTTARRIRAALKRHVAA